MKNSCELYNLEIEPTETKNFSFENAVKVDDLGKLFVELESGIALKLNENERDDLVAN